ncbi:autophagy-related protein 2 homolog A isoform X3 [Tribolium madens]|uniref:autophagy-related protein 2 homolog A isoform X3 n=1 Tax=Tribolium madens TaxID=41895 RepID=UPI001CF72CD3|nr:autophagy-related protein 2 homolog A isoform X3 [Tribolium madens]
MVVHCTSCGLLMGIKTKVYVNILYENQHALRYLGQYFEEKLDPSQLSVDLYNGTCVLKDIRLDVEALNELSEKQNWPLEFVDGSIENLFISVPWSSLLKESSTIEVTSLRITMQPKQRYESEIITATSMFESMWTSMTSSLHLAEECAKQGFANSPNSAQTYEGLEVFAQTIDSILSRIKVTFINSVFQLEHLPKGSPMGVGVVINVDLIMYADESSNDPPKEEATDLTKQDDKKAYLEQSYTARLTRLEGISISTVEFSSNARTVSQSVISESNYYDKDDSFATIIEGDSEKCSKSSNQDQYSSSDERNVIMFGKFGGKVEVVVRLKRTEDLEGPKVSIEMDTGPLLLFLSPRQLHLLIELVKGLLSPDTEDHSNILSTKFVGKPMSSADYERIEKDLQQQLTHPGPSFPIHGVPGGHGWATGALDGSDIEDNFMPLGKYSGALYESAMSGASMESSMSSSMISSYTDVTNRARKKLNKIDTDPTAEISRFEIHLSSLAVLLLHEDLLTESLGAKCSLVASSVKQMQDTVAKFFTNSVSVFSAKDFNSLNVALDHACQLNHLRLLASPLHLEGDEKTTSSAFSVTGYLEATNLELSECLFQSNNDNVEHVPLITFSDVKPNQFGSPVTAKPSLKLMFKYLVKTTKNSLTKGGPKTEFMLSLHKCVLELDVTLIDRISALLNPQPICVVAKPTNPWTNNVTTHLMNDSNETKFDIRVNSPLMTVKLRFPIPDFRPPHDMNKTPWWKRHVRADFLSLVLTGASFQTSFQANQTVQDYTLECRSLNIFYQEDANGDVLPVGKAGYEDKPMTSLQDVITECKLNIKVFPAKRLSLEEPSQTIQEPISTSIVGFLENRKPNGPFSAKRVIHESDTPHHKYQSELLVPGDKSEINEFIKSTTLSARVRIDISLPIVSMQLISKRLYETIYNRINNDLLLWEPSAPKPKPTRPAYDNINYGPFGNIEMEGQEVFTLCKSGIQYDSESETDDENEEDTNIFYSTYGSKMKISQKQIVSESKEESYLTMNLQIGRGLLCMCTPVRDATNNHVIPNQQGEFLINVEDATIFLVNGYMGDPNLGFTCLELHNAQLYHCDMISTPSHSPPLKDIGATPGKHLHPTIYSSEPGMLANGRDRGGNREMVTLCVKIQASHETHHVKNVSIAAGFNKVTLRHRMCNEPNSWVSQLTDFFNVTDYPIPGYHAKEILTELFLHFWDSAIDYRPKYLPLRSAITLGNFSISSHLSAEVNTSTLRFIAEECGLFLSQKGVKKTVLPYTGPVDLKRDYVNVIDLGLFEISLKTSDKKNFDTPHFDLRASNNIIHIRTCADSARALTQLIKYLANYGDLVLPDDSTSNGSTFSSPRHLPEHELVSVEPQEITNLSESQHQQIHDLIQDALEDVDQNTQNQVKSDLYTYNGTKMFYFPDEKNPQDSGKPLPQVTTELGQLPFQPNTIESDDEFCFIDEEPGYNIFPKNGIPEIKWLTDDPVRIVDNHFAVPSEKCDPLKTPKNFPTPTRKYTLCEMSIVWHMYGGNDFGPVDKEKKKTVNFSDLKIKDSVSFSTLQKDKVVIESEKIRKKSWLTKGGPNRDHNILMELQLNKIRFQHEVYPDSSSKASRQVLIISEIEMRDRLKSSQMNKFLYQYISQVRPKQSNANMLVIKTLHIRPDPQLRSQECCLKVSVLPLRFNIDQDALQFLISFFTELGSDMKDDELQVNSKHSTPVHQPPVMTVGEDNDEKLKEEAKKIVDENLLILLEENKNEEKPTEESQISSSSGSEDSPVYFRKVIFSPDVPIRLDYHGKHFDLRTHGPLQGLLMGLAQLNCSELRLKRISHRHGLLGFEKLMMFLIKEWVNDIKKNQIPSLLVGVGPMYSFVQLFQGIRDLFCLPFEQYKKDGRFFRGLHRGANSFTTSTAMAALELTTRLIQLIQITAETAFDMLTPGPSVKVHPKTKVRRKRYSQPKDIREGVTNAYKLVKEGIEETADNILQVASHEHEQKGYSGAVGGVIRQIPPTIIKPIIIASEATNNVLGGMRCQLVPDARKEANEKWRNEDTYDSYE